MPDRDLNAGATRQNDTFCRELTMVGTDRRAWRGHSPITLLQFRLPRVVFLPVRRKALLPQIDLGFPDIAIGRQQGLLALHHPGTRALAEIFNELCGDLRHNSQRYHSC